jgi:hypothetical protein
MKAHALLPPVYRLYLLSETYDCEPFLFCAFNSETKIEAVSGHAGWNQSVFIKVIVHPAMALLGYIKGRTLEQPE